MKIKEKKSEIFLLAIVTLISLAANLPDQILGEVIDRKLLLIVLGGVVVIALFNYLDILLFLCVVVLAIGANLPNQFSDSLGISPMVMLAFLVLLVVISLINTAFKKFENIKGEQNYDSGESRKAILAAISKGDLTKLHWLLNNKVEINFTDNGVSPVMLAAEKGYTDVIQSLINYGADLNVMNSDGKTPIEVAQAHGFNRTAEIIKLAGEGGKLGWTK
ncbi:MAG: ankyrin repeat domain-containing protein [Gallionella sp.]